MSVVTATTPTPRRPAIGVPVRRSGRSAVLDCFARSGGELGVSDVAAQTGLTISTAHRLMRALVDAGLLGQDDRTSRYHLGPTLVAMGRRAEAILGFDRLEPELRALSARTGESVDVGTRVGDEVLVALHLPSTPAVAVRASPPGADCRCTPRRWARRCWPSPRTRPTRSPRSAGLRADFTGLADHVDARPARGPRRDAAPGLGDERRGDRDSGVRTIGVPLLRADGRPFAAIAVQGPEVRIPDDRVAELAGDLMRTAAALIGTSY